MHTHTNLQRNDFGTHRGVPSRKSPQDRLLARTYEHQNGVRHQDAVWSEAPGPCESVRSAEGGLYKQLMSADVEAHLAECPVVSCGKMPGL